MALTHTPQAEIGAPCPDFSLPKVDGGQMSLADLRGKPILVMFICNHCPYVKAIEDRLITLGHDLRAQNVGVVAICSNDAKDYPDDAPENLRKRAQEKSYSFPYLHDETQDVAKRFGAVCTPDFFLYNADGRLAYRGRLDDSWKDPNAVTKRELYEAAMTLAKGQSLQGEQIPSMGCSIKWKK